MSRRHDLRDLLEAHQPSDAVEAGHLRAMVALLGAHQDPLSRDVFDPGHFTASGFVVSPDRELLMVLHRRLGRWLQPGGHIDAGDASACAAALREVAEETGIGPSPGGCTMLDVDVHQIPASPAEPAHLHFDVRFHFEAQGRIEPRAEVADARWVPFRSLAELGIDDSVRRAVEKL